MKINNNIYPYNPDSMRFPIYLTGIGGSEFQGAVNRPEGYQWHQIFYCASGKGYLKHDSNIEEILPGDYFFIPANYASEYFGEKSQWDVRWVAFGGYALEMLLEKFEMTMPIVIKNIKDDKLENIFDKMYTAQLTEREIADYICSGLIYEYVIEFKMHMDTGKKKAERERSNLLLPVLTYIENNLCRDITIVELANLAGVTHQHLCRVFKEAFNLRPVEYIMHKRIERSKELLMIDSNSIADVAEKMGFNNVGYFSTVFKKYEGISPNKLKKVMGGR